MGTNSSNNQHIAMLPSPGLGHITPLFELAKLLVTHHGLHISFLVVPSQSSTAQNDLLRSPTVPSGLHIIDLPAADMSHVIKDDTGHLSIVCLMVHEHVRTLPDVLNGLINRPKSMIVDLFTTDAFEACESLSITVYGFCTKVQESAWQMVGHLAGHFLVW